MKPSQSHESVKIQTKILSFDNELRVQSLNSLQHLIRSRDRMDSVVEHATEQHAEPCKEKHMHKRNTGEQKKEQKNVYWFKKWFTT